MGKFEKDLERAYGEFVNKCSNVGVNSIDVGDSDSMKRYNMIVSEMSRIYSKKNKDYGNSFDTSLDEDGLLVAKIRLGDKYKRFSQLIKNSAEVKDESKRDTLIDMANYAIMTVMWMDLQEELEAIEKMNEEYPIDQPGGIVCGYELSGADTDGDTVIDCSKTYYDGSNLYNRDLKESIETNIVCGGK